MIRRFGSLIVLVLIAFGTAKAEVLTASVHMATENEVPAVMGLNASADCQVTFNITRDPQTGSVTNASAQFLATVNFPGAVSFTGFHIHEGASTVNAAVVINTGISGS